MSVPLPPDGVSVALCTYNGERFLREQLESIAAQTVLPTELVVGDDASTDSTRDIVAAFADHAPFAVRLVARPLNVGASANFGDTLRATRCAFVALSDQDDRWREDRIERTLAAFDARPEASLVFSDARLVDANGASLGTRLFESLGVSAHERATIATARAFDTLLRRNVVTGATATVRRKLVDLALPIGALWVHDEWLAMVASLLDGANLAVVSEPLIDYRQHGSNLIGALPLTRRQLVDKLFARRDGRCERLAHRTAALLDKAVALGPAIAPDRIAALRDKLAHMRFRAALPEARWKRVAPVVAEAAAGRYARFSTGVRAIAQDLCAAA